MEGMLWEHYNLAMYERDASAMQVFVSSRTSISMIEYVKDPSGDEFWTRTDDIFTLTATPALTAAHEIYVAKGEEYLVFKLTSESRIYVMGVCDFGDYFDHTTFECKECSHGRKSFGIQATECDSCSALWFKTRTVEVDFAKYSHMCTDGRTKSIFLLVLTPVLVLLCSVLIWWRIGKKVDYKSLKCSPSCKNCPGCSRWESDEEDKAKESELKENPSEDSLAQFDSLARRTGQTSAPSKNSQQPAKDSSPRFKEPDRKTSIVPDNKQQDQKKNEFTPISKGNVGGKSPPKSDRKSPSPLRNIPIPRRDVDESCEADYSEVK